MQKWKTPSGNKQLILVLNEYKYLYRIYESQDEIAVFQTSWITEILQRQCQLHDIVLGQHLLCPHFLAPIATPEILNSRARALPSTHETYSDAQALDGGPGGDGKMTEGELWTDNMALDGGRGEEGKMTEVKLWAELETQALACKMAGKCEHSSL